MTAVLNYLKQNKIKFALITLAVLAFTLYANTLGNKMFWDDNDFILNNQYVANFQVGHMFSENVIAGSGFVSNYWRPVLLFVFSIEHHIWGAHVFGYHLVNLLFHLANALLLFFLLQSLFKKYSLSLLTSIIFLIHPLQTEAVSYVNSLGDSLSVFFILLGLNNYQDFCENNSKNSLYWSIAMYPLALMSKETAIVYPGLIALVEFFQTNPLNIKARFKNILKFIWPYAIIAGVYLILRATVLNFQNSFNLYNAQNTFTSSILVRIFTFFKILTNYFSLLFYPHNQHMERSLPIATSFFNGPVLLGFTFFVILSGLIIWAWKKRPVISFGLLWFIFCLVPTSNILVPINGLLYEHWLYLPLVGLFLAIFGFVLNLNITKSKTFQIISIGCLVLYFLFLSITTIARNRQWRDPITFYNQTLQYAPNSYRVVNNLGMAYDDAGDHQKAMESYQRAIAIDPSVQVAYHNLGNAYKTLGQFDLAIQNFETALSKDSNFFYSYNALAGLFLDQNKPQEAIAELKKLQALYPENQYTAGLIKQIQGYYKI